MAFEQRRVRLEETGARDSLTARLDRVVGEAGEARLRFEEADRGSEESVLGRVLLNATLRQQEIADYQLKEPFFWLRNRPEWGSHSWKVGDTGFEPVTSAV